LACCLPRNKRSACSEAKKPFGTLLAITAEENVCIANSYSGQLVAENQNLNNLCYFLMSS
jgi:hypothetical protein